MSLATKLNGLLPPEGSEWRRPLVTIYVVATFLATLWVVGKIMGFVSPGENFAEIRMDLRAETLARARGDSAITDTLARHDAETRQLFDTVRAIGRDAHAALTIMCHQRPEDSACPRGLR